MSNRNSSTYGVNLPHDVLADIKSRKLVVAEVVRTSLLLARLEPKYLYEVSYSKESIRFYCIVKGITESLVIKEIHRNNYLSARANAVGIGEFDIRLVGCFPKMLDAMKVLNIYSNDSLDNGYNVLNVGYTRMIHFIADNVDSIMKVLPDGVSLGVLLSEVISIINADFVETGVNDKVIKHLKKRIRSSTKLRN